MIQGDDEDYESSIEDEDEEEGSPSLTDWPATMPPTSQSAPARHSLPSVPSGPARPCLKRVDLYSLQADRLNTSGAFNPLKGKLTNCHVTGCER